MIQTFNGLIIINGKVTLNVNTGYVYANTPGEDVETLWFIFICVLY